jgi:hypothetical protein
MAQSTSVAHNKKSHSKNVVLSLYKYVHIYIYIYIYIYKKIYLHLLTIK